MIHTYSLEEAATQLGVTEQWLSRRLRSGRVRGYKAGRKWRMTANDIEAAVDALRLPQVHPYGMTPTSARRRAS